MKPALLWVPIGGLALWAAARLSGLDAWYPMVQLLAFTPYVAAFAVLPVVVALALRRWWAAAAAAAVALVLALCVLPRAFSAGDSPPHGPSLRVLSMNMRIGGADPAAIVTLVRQHRVDLLAVQEYTPEAQEALDKAGLRTLLPNRVAYPQPGVVGSAVYSRFPLHDDGLRVHRSGFSQAQATVTVPGVKPVPVESVHPCAPATAGLTNRYWGPELADQPPATVDGPVRVLLGDFNATLDHAPLRRLLATGYRDAADVRGDGFTPTWPYDGKPVPGVTLDHVLADRRVGVRDYAVHTVANTDHRAVYAELTLPEGA